MHGLIERLQQLEAPAGVMRVFTTRRSSFCRSRVIRLRFSMRSRSRVMSGSCEIMRSAMLLHARPSGSAPRRMRRRVVLRRGQIVGFQQLFHLLRQGVGCLLQGDEDVGLE